MEQEARIRTMPLPVQLTKPELDVRAQELASAEGVLDEAETRLDRWTEAAKETKKGIENEISDARDDVRRLALIVREGREKRDVQVVDESDFEAAVVRTVRVDTGAIVATRGMTPEERQRGLFHDAKAGAQA